MKKNAKSCLCSLGFGLVALTIAVPASSQSKQTISNLPNGNYFYSTSRNPYQSGAEYLIFRKTGNTITGMKYPVPGETTCFSGRSRSRGITNVIIYLQPLGTGAGEFRRRNPINLNSYYRLRFDSAPDFAKRGRDRCLRVFSNYRQ